ncbi:hypothetical protein MHYP_G00149680 [Metynnis hypsauchen]
MSVKMDHRVCAKNIYETARGKTDMNYVNMDGNVGKMALGNDFAGNKMDDYENAAVTVHQREVSDDPDEGYIDLEKMAMDNHFKDEKNF